ncbi:MAG: DUF2127 domain-containing protein [Candidatus Methylomirabilaceae bacterium]
MTSRDIGLRAIIFFKGFYGVLFLLVGLGVFALINRDVSEVAERAADSLGVDPENRYLLWLLDRLVEISPRQIATVGFAAILYSALLLTMAWGLHLRQVWAEWLTIVATGLLIPVEIHEVVQSPRLIYILVLVINVCIVWYLVRRRTARGRAEQHIEASVSRGAPAPPSLRS